jgi:putative ABC transport system permease protein
MGARLLRGRSFTERDTESSPWVAVINESLARQFFPDEDPIGKTLYTDQAKPREIVGIVSDIRQKNLQNIRYPATIYAPHTQHLTEYAPGGARNYLNKQLILKTSVNPTSLAADLRRIVADVDPGVYVSDIETMQARLDMTVTTERFWMRTLGIFSTLALVLATVGIYGVVAYAVAQRTHEIGVRMALGAQRTDVLKMVLRQGMVLSLGGLIVGVLGAVAATRLLSSWVYEIEATDPATFATVAVVLVGIALLATYVPARGATRVDPVNAMRSE